MSKRGAIIAGSAGIIGLGTALLVKQIIEKRKKEEEESKKYAIILEATVGGTTNPSPNTYYSESPVYLRVTAIPSAGYLFDGWYLEGERVSTDLSYNIYVDRKYIVLTASFVEIGAPPLIPAYVRPVKNATIEEGWCAWKENTQFNSIVHLNYIRHKNDVITFRICDIAGNGVKDQFIALYTDSNPDEYGYGYFYLSNREYTRNNPIILKSNAEGNVTISCNYKWLEPGNLRYTIGSAIKGFYWCLYPIWGGAQYPMSDGQSLTLPCYWDRIERVKHPILHNVNYVYAYWVDNPNLPVWGNCAVNCLVYIDNVLYK